MSYPFPILNLNFAESKQLGHPAVSFSRASQGSYWQSKTNTGADGKLAYASNNVPRFDHDPLTGICKGLLIEPAVTFLDTYSEQFDNAAWPRSGVSVTANAAIAPDGTMTADKIVENTTNSAHYFVFPVVNVVASQAYTLSAYFKAAEKTWVALQAFDGINNPTMYVNLSTGVVGNVSNVTSSKIESCGNGWYRCFLTFTAVGTAQISFNMYVCSANMVASYTGDGTSGLYIWGAKFYAGTGPTSYLPTTSAGVTRAADSCVADLTKLKDAAGNALWTGQEGTIVVDFEITTALTPGVTAVIAQLWYDTNNRIVVYGFGQEQVLRMAVFSGGVRQFDTTILSSASNKTRYKIAFGFSSSGSSGVVNNGTLVFGGSITMPTPATRLDLFNWNTTPQASGYLNSLQLYNKRISDAYLKLLSVL